MTSKQGEGDLSVQRRFPHSNAYFFGAIEIGAIEIKEGTKKSCLISCGAMLISEDRN